MRTLLKTIFIAFLTAGGCRRTRNSVTLSKDLSWKHHVNVITSKATNTRLFLQRNLTFADSETKLKCYKAYVRPIVEYASSVWNPVNNSSLIKKIKSVQRKSLRWIYKKWSYTVLQTFKNSLVCPHWSQGENLQDWKCFMIYSIRKNMSVLSVCQQGNVA